MKRHSDNVMARSKLWYGIVALALLSGLLVFGRLSSDGFVRSGIIRIMHPAFAVSNLIAWGLHGLIPQSDREADASRIREEHERLRQIEQEYQVLLGQYAGLRKIVGLKEAQRVALEGAHVLMRGNQFGKEFLLIDRGALHHVRQGNLVVDAKRFLVGVVREAEEQAAKVSLASNVGETFEVVMAPLDVKALGKGIGNRTFSLELIPDDTPIHPGDFALMPGRLGDTSIFVGEITRVTPNGAGAFQNVWATLLARPEAAGEVFILLEPERL